MQPYLYLWATAFGPILVENRGKPKIWYSVVYSYQVNYCNASHNADFTIYAFLTAR